MNLPNYTRLLLSVTCVTSPNPNIKCKQNPTIMQQSTKTPQGEKEQPCIKDTNYVSANVFI